MLKFFGAFWLGQQITRGRLRKRKKSYAKHARRLVSSVIRSEWTRRGFWPRPWAELRWAAGSFDALN